MKKLISILMALSASLMFTVIASATEAPEFIFDVQQIPTSEFEEYEIEGDVDAYLLNINITGVDAERANKNSPAGRIMDGLKMTLSADATAMSFVKRTATSMYDSSMGATAAVDTGGIAIGFTSLVDKNSGFPAKGETVTKTDISTIATMVISIETGKSITFNVTDLSCVFTTYESGSSVDKTDIGYNMENPNSPVICSNRTITLGTPGETTSGKPKFFTAELNPAESQMSQLYKYLVFQFKDESIADIEKQVGKKEIEISSDILSNDTYVEIPVKVENVPSTSTMKLEKIYWNTSITR